MRAGGREGEELIRGRRGGSEGAWKREGMVKGRAQGRLGARGAAVGGSELEVTAPAW